MLIDNSLLLSKTSIYESVNRTFFTISGVAIALLASTQTKLYNNEDIRNAIAFIAILILAMNILYGFFNLTDYKIFIDKFKTKDNNDILSIYFEYSIYVMYSLLILLSFVLICNIVMLI